jgi:hypothetical protein
MPVRVDRHGVCSRGHFHYCWEQALPKPRGCGLWMRAVMSAIRALAAGRS